MWPEVSLRTCLSLETCYHVRSCPPQTCNLRVARRREMAPSSCNLAQLAPWATHAGPRPSQRQAFRKQLADVVRNGQPFAFRGAHGRPVVLCLLPKVGSTTWKLALLSALHPRRHKWLLERSPHQRRSVHELPPFTGAKLRRAVS